jgi:flagellar motility protein MotE (MotC chaperone)
MFCALQKKVLVGALLAVAMLTPVAAQQAPAARTPVQLAYLKSETKKANEAFIKQVAKATGAGESLVRRALPDEKRITDRLARLVSALEKDLKRPLTEDEKSAIAAAEDVRKKAISEAELAAASK